MECGRTGAAPDWQSQEEADGVTPAGFFCGGTAARTFDRGSLPPVGPLDSFSEVVGVRQPSGRKRTSGVPGVV
jgi:hypothetical protein